MIVRFTKKPKNRTLDNRFKYGIIKVGKDKSAQTRRKPP